MKVYFSRSEEGVIRVRAERELNGQKFMASTALPADDKLVSFKLDDLRAAVADAIVRVDEAFARAGKRRSAK